MKKNIPKNVRNQQISNLSEPVKFLIPINIKMNSVVILAMFRILDSFRDFLDYTLCNILYIIYTMLLWTTLADFVSIGYSQKPKIATHVMK